MTLLKSIGGTHPVNVYNEQDNVGRLVADLSSAIGDEVALPQMAQAELEKIQCFHEGHGDSCQVVASSHSNFIVPATTCYE